MLPLFWLKRLSKIAVFMSLATATHCLAHMPHPLVHDLEMIHHILNVGYAPALWKKECFGWNLTAEFDKAKKRLTSLKRPNHQDYRLILKEFVGSLRDYHTDIQFFSTEAAFLPFRIKGAEGRYFIEWIEEGEKLAFNIGDEVLRWDGRPVKEIVRELMAMTGQGRVSETDHALAEMRLTQRQKGTGDVVPQGSVILLIQKQNGSKPTSCRVAWQYIAEDIITPLYFKAAPYLPSGKITCNTSQHIVDQRRQHLEALFHQRGALFNPLHQCYAIRGKKMGEERGLGGDTSFLPPLGNIWWQYEERYPNNEEEERLTEAAIQWHAYAYIERERGVSIGYVRIPHYIGSTEDLAQFGTIIQWMEKNTDLLVIDQLHNFGGYIYFLYELASMLTDMPLTTACHRVKLTSQDAFQAYQLLQLLKVFETAWDEAGEFAHSLQKECGVTLTYNRLMGLKRYYQFLLDEWSQGKSLTDPTPLWGIDVIEPHPKIHYTKPILLLIDALDFSGGDFLPALLQDNGRALLFGQKTAGAGGFVASLTFPNQHGIAKLTYTASIAERANAQKIENCGVTPDIPYQLTAADLQHEYEGYRQAVNQCVRAILEEYEKYGLQSNALSTR